MILDFGKSISSTLNGLFKSQVTDEKIEEAIKEVCTSLVQSNVNPKYVARLRGELREKLSKELPPGYNKAKGVQNAVFDALVKLLDGPSQSASHPVGHSVSQSYTSSKSVSRMDTQSVTPHPAQARSHSSPCPSTQSTSETTVIIFVGLQGSGKTTSICKYANYHKKKGKKVGIVCADTFRAGAFDQVRQNALKIKVPFYGSSEVDPVKVSREGVEKFKKEKFNMILVDTSGRHTQEKDLFKEMKDIIEGVSNSFTTSKVIFIMDAGIGQSAEMQALGFKEHVDLGSIILTKLDGTSKAGGAISSVAATGCPIEFIGTGEGMEDLEVFNARRFVSRMLGMGDVEGLMERVSDLKIDEKEMVGKLKEGKFTLKDFYEQFQQILAMGPVGRLLEMIPGMSGMNIPDEKTFRKLIYIFDSFSEDELDSDGSSFERQPGRAVRVARGSGTSVRAVTDLLFQFRNISTMMKKFANMPGFSNLLGGGGLNMSQKAKMKQQSKQFLPKEMFDQMSQFFK